jgi:hypothetical protein
MDPKKIKKGSVRVWTGFFWLKIRFSGRLF